MRSLYVYLPYWFKILYTFVYETSITRFINLIMSYICKEIPSLPLLYGIGSNNYRKEETYYYIFCRYNDTHHCAGLFC